MGIRIHKYLGYGLTDVECEDAGEITDPRINTESWLLNWEADTPSLEDYAAWLAEHADDQWWERHYLASREKGCRRRRSDSDGVDLQRLVEHHSEYGLKNVLIVLPFNMPDWRRWDDSLDYYEDQHNGEPHVKLLDSGIYPWSAAYTDTRTGEDVKGHEIMMWVRAKNSNIERDRIDLDLFARESGFADHDEALKYCQPRVPDPIRNICRFGKLFHDDMTIHRLRPMIYTRWG